MDDDSRRRFRQWIKRRNWTLLFSFICCPFNNVRVAYRTGTIDDTVKEFVVFCAPCIASSSEDEVSCTTFTYLITVHFKLMNIPGILIIEDLISCLNLIYCEHPSIPPSSSSPPRPVNAFVLSRTCPLSPRSPLHIIRLIFKILKITTRISVKNLF
jgi:hypothetical protein